MNNVKHTTESLMSEHVKALARFWVQKHAVTNQCNSQLTQPGSKSDAKPVVEEEGKEKKMSTCFRRTASEALMF